MTKSIQDFYKRAVELGTFDRNMEIFQRHRDGESFNSIAKTYGLSAGRVRQIYNKVVRVQSKFDQENTFSEVTP